MLKGRKALVTGGSRGIGRQIALDFAKQGADVSIIYAGDQQAAEETLSSIKEYGVNAWAYKCDVSDYSLVEDICKQVHQQMGGLDILVNNAGVVRDSLILRMNEQQFDEVIGVNLKGAFNFIKHTSRYLLKSEAGRIINISSVSGLMGNAGQANYSAAKAGVIGLTKTAAKEFAGRKLTVNAIAPGFIATDMTEKLNPAIIESAIQMIPLKRFGQVEEIASLAAYLASSQAGYMTGQIIAVDGGLYI